MASPGVDLHPEKLIIAIDAKARRWSWQEFTTNK